VNTPSFKLEWSGTGFGNSLIMAHLTKILVDNGIDAVFNHRRKTTGLVDVPLYDPSDPIKRIVFHGVLHCDFETRNAEEPVMMYYIREFRRMTGKYIEFDRKYHNFVPVIFNELDTIKGVDVALCTKTGTWTPYRNWPYFDELKKMLQVAGISYIDLNNPLILSNDCLNIVAKSKVYVGLDTGTSHYVSKFANRKGLIIQGGFNPFFIWAWPYEYEPIVTTVKCKYRPCFINKNDIYNGIVCNEGVSCISKISVKQVFDRIMEKLK
jgi:hypothetical protein